MEQDGQPVKKEFEESNATEKPTNGQLQKEIPKETTNNTAELVKDSEIKPETEESAKVASPERKPEPQTIVEPKEEIKDIEMAEIKTEESVNAVEKIEQKESVNPEVKNEWEKSSDSENSKPAFEVKPEEEASAPTPPPVVVPGIPGPPTGIPEGALPLQGGPMPPQMAQGMGPGGHLQMPPHPMQPMPHHGE